MLLWQSVPPRKSVKSVLHATTQAKSVPQKSAICRHAKVSKVCHKKVLHATTQAKSVPRHNKLPSVSSVPQLREAYATPQCNMQYVPRLLYTPKVFHTTTNHLLLQKIICGTMQSRIELPPIMCLTWQSDRKYTWVQLSTLVVTIYMARWHGASPLTLHYTNISIYMARWHGASTYIYTSLTYLRLHLHLHGTVGCVTKATSVTLDPYIFL